MDTTMETTKFLLTAKKAGYAAGRKALLLLDGGKQFVFESAEFKYVDIYYGHTPFGGHELLSKKWLDGSLMPIWYMNYGGVTTPNISNYYSAEVIFTFLRLALLEIDTNSPFRGPKEFESEDFLYKSNFSGNVDRFAGEEEIHHYGELVYMGNFSGGMLQEKKVLDAIT